MKTVIRTSILFLLAAGLFTSCSKNKAEKPDNKILIVGTWQAKVMEYYFQPDGSTQREFVSSEAQDGAIEFTADGKLVNTDGNTTTYSVSGDKLTITPARGESVEFTINKIDKNNLVLDQNLGKDDYNGKSGTVFQTLKLTK